MQLRASPPIHLTYCLNIHPGETWEENLAAIQDKVLRVRHLVAAGRRFGLGLRLGARAAGELAQGDNLQRFAALLAAEDLYAFTINGFPYGQFHNTAVKQDVYAPDWRSDQRRDYTKLLADILADLLPNNIVGSISTVPGSYKAWARSTEDLRQIAWMLADAAVHLHVLHEDRGKEIILALEPEPDCLLETTAEAIAFYNGPLMDYGTQHLSRRLGITHAEGAALLRGHLGVCLDTAHAAVEFEPPGEALAQLRAAGVPVGKIQLSSALALAPTSEALAQLADFVDPVYLHQVKVRRTDGSIQSFADLPEALANPPAGGTEWRVHFHVPLFFRVYAGLRSTSDLLSGTLPQQIRAGACSNIEIETYTFSVLPEFLRPGDVTESIAEEYRWVLENLFPADVPMHQKTH
jgi:hypothetical protein